MKRPNSPSGPALRTPLQAVVLAGLLTPALSAQSPLCDVVGLQCLPDPYTPGAPDDALITFDDARPTSIDVPTGAAGPAVKADFTGDGRLDVLTTFGGVPYLLVSPATLDHVIELEVPAGVGSITSVAIERVSGISLPVMRGSGASDIVRWTIDTSSGQITATSGASMLNGAGGGGGTPPSDWAGAKFMTTADFDGIDTECVVGYFEYPVPIGGIVGALRVGLWNANGTIDTHVEIETSTYFSGLVATNWDAERAGDEIGVTMGSRLVIVDRDLAFLDIAFLPHNAVLSAPLSDQKGAGVAVVVGVPQSGGARHDYVQVVRPSSTSGGAVLEPLVDTGLFDLSAIAVGNGLVGGSADLVLGADSIFVLQNESAGGGTTFPGVLLDDYADALAPLENGDGAPPPGWILTGDFDRDGDVDVVATSAGSVTVDRNDAMPESALAVMLESNEDFRDWDDVPGPGPGERTLTIELRSLAILQFRGAYTIEAELYLPGTGAAFNGAFSPGEATIDPSASPSPFTGTDTVEISIVYDDPGVVTEGAVVLRGRQDNSGGNPVYYPDLFILVPINDPPPPPGFPGDGNARLRPVSDPPNIEDDRVPFNGNPQ